MRSLCERLLKFSMLRINYSITIHYSYSTWVGGVNGEIAFRKGFFSRLSKTRRPWSWSGASGSALIAAIRTVFGGPATSRTTRRVTHGAGGVHAWSPSMPLASRSARSNILRRRSNESSTRPMLASSGRWCHGRLPLETGAVVRSAAIIIWKVSSGSRHFALVNVFMLLTASVFFVRSSSAIDGLCRRQMQHVLLHL